MICSNEESPFALLEAARLPPDMTDCPSICVFMGSFDPPHRGHAWLVQELLKRFKMVLLLIPKVHYCKTLKPLENASFEERLGMLEAIRNIDPARIGTALTNEVLFIRLDKTLRKLLTHSAPGYSMGDTTWSRFCDSPRYYERLGVKWTAEDDAAFESLRKRVCFFDRSARTREGIPVPKALRAISSSQVRRTAAALERLGLDLEAWLKALEALVPPGVAREISQKGLYRGN